MLKSSGKENCVERRIDDFGGAINGDQEEGTAEWRALRNTIFCIVDGGVVTGSLDTKGAFFEIVCTGVSSIGKW